MSKLVDLDASAWNTYCKLTEGVGEQYEGKAPPSFLNGYHDEDASSTWQPVKKRGNAAMEDERSRQLFQSAEDGVGRAELKRLQKERTRKMQTSNVTLSFGAEPDYTTAASMPDYTRHTRAENIRRIRRGKKEDNLVVDKINNKNNPDYERTLGSVAKTTTKPSSPTPKERLADLRKSHIVFGAEGQEEKERWGDYIPKNRSVAREGMLVKGANDNDLRRWKEEAKEKKFQLQSTSLGMQFGDGEETKMNFETESAAAMKRMLAKKKAGGEGWKQERFTGGKRGLHTKDTVGELLGGDPEYS